MIDLTTITTPFGLLDAEMRAALRAHGGPYEYWNGGSWTNSASETLHDIDTALTYRAKPAPPKPREWWLCAESEAHIPTVRGFLPADGEFGIVVHVREVLP